MNSKLVYSFGPYLLDPFRGILLRSGEYVNVDPQAFEVLLVLAQAGGEYVPREEMLSRAWKGAHVGNGSLHFQINQLRSRVFAGEGGGGVSIQTSYKRGYRLRADVKIMYAGGPDAVTEADRLYMEGRYFWQKSTAQSVRRAIELFTKAVEVDSEHVSALVGLADSWTLAGCFAHQYVAAAVAMAEAEVAANKALDVDGSCAEAHAALASVCALFRWDWAAAEREYEIAFRSYVNPMLRSWRTLFLAARGEHELAQAEIEEAIRRDPTLFVLKAIRGRVYYLAGDPERAADECRKAIEFEENFYLSYLFLGHALRQQNKLAEAAGAFRRAGALTQDPPAVLAELGHVYAARGDEPRARQILSRMESTSLTQYVSPYLFGHVHYGLGDLQEFFDYMEQALLGHEAYMIFLSADPLYDPVRRDSRFVELVRHIGFQAN